VELKGDSAKALNALGRVYMKTGRYAEAKEILESAKKADPKLEETSVLLNNIREELTPEPQVYRKRSYAKVKGEKGKKGKKDKKGKRGKSAGKKKSKKSDKDGSKRSVKKDSKKKSAKGVKNKKASSGGKGKKSSKGKKKK